MPPHLESCEPDPGGATRARLRGSLHALLFLGGRVLVVQLSSEFNVEDVWPQEAVGEVLEDEHLASIRCEASAHERRFSRG